MHELISAIAEHCSDPEAGLGPVMSADALLRTPGT